MKNLIPLALCAFICLDAALAQERCSDPIYAISKGRLNGAVDRLGKIRIAANYETLDIGNYSTMALSAPPYPAKLPGGSFGYVNEAGKWIIEPKFERATLFKGGVAAVRESEGKEYLISPEGIKVGGDWEAISLPDSGIATMRKSGKIFYVDGKGKILFQSPSDPLSSKPPDALKSLFADDHEPFWFNFREGLAPFKKNNRWGLINSGGEIVVPEQFDSVLIQKNFVVVSVGDHQGIIDRVGHYILNPAKVGIQHCDNEEDICSVQTGGTFDFRLYSVSQRKFLPGTYSDVRGCSEGLCIVAKDEGKGCTPEVPCYFAVDAQGKVKSKLPSAKGLVTTFQEGLASFSLGSNKGGSMGFFDRRGRVVIEPQFDGEISSFECGIARVLVGDRVGLIDRHGRFIWNPQ